MCNLAVVTNNLNTRVSADAHAEQEKPHWRFYLSFQVIVCLRVCCLSLCGHFMVLIFVVISGLLRILMQVFWSHFLVILFGLFSRFCGYFWIFVGILSFFFFFYVCKCHAYMSIHRNRNQI